MTFLNIIKNFTIMTIQEIKEANKVKFANLGTFKNPTDAKKKTGISYLGGVDSSAKVKKGVSAGYSTFILYLAPADLSGFNTCAKYTKECKDSCLFMAGRSKFDANITTCRINRTHLFYFDRQFFNAWLSHEIAKFLEKCKVNNMVPVIRLNGTSDLSPSLFNINGISMVEKYSSAQFYDYTKVYNRFSKLVPNNNYHITFSYTGEIENHRQAMELLQRGYNVAMVLDVHKNKPLPSSLFGFEVIDGDKTDIRPLDKRGVIVGLRFKQTKSFQAMPKQERQQWLNDNIFIVQCNPAPITRQRIRVMA